MATVKRKEPESLKRSRPDGRVIDALDRKLLICLRCFSMDSSSKIMLTRLDGSRFFILEFLF